MFAALVVAVETIESVETFPWLGSVIGLVTLLLGSGGVVAWRRLSHDKRQGIAQQELAEDDALTARWRAIIEVQTKSLLEPMQTRLKDVEGKVAGLEQELADSRRKYWSLISYVRTLLTWIARHMPDEIDHAQVPSPPVMLAEDI